MFTILYGPFTLNMYPYSTNDSDEAASVSRKVPQISISTLHLHSLANRGPKIHYGVDDRVVRMASLAIRGFALSSSEDAQEI